MNVLLISANREDINMLTLPMGLACLAAAVEKDGHAVRFLDLLSVEDIPAAVKELIFNPLFFGDFFFLLIPEYANIFCMKTKIPAGYTNCSEAYNEIKNNTNYLRSGDISWERISRFSISTKPNLRKGNRQHYNHARL